MESKFHFIFLEEVCKSHLRALVAQVVKSWPARYQSRFKFCLRLFLFIITLLSSQFTKGCNLHPVGHSNMWKVPPTSAESVPCLHWFQKILWQSMACSLMGHHVEVQYQCKSSSHHWAALWQGYKCSPDEWQHRRMVQNNSRSKARMSSVTHPLQHFSRTDHVWCPGRTWWES